MRWRSRRGRGRAGEEGKDKKEMHNMKRRKEWDQQTHNQFEPNEVDDEAKRKIKGGQISFL